ncbi:MAG TPA: glycosyltransferase family 4 protein, partial [Candidatus Saccharimonadales bacterium]|nr:glycosyltransferase family 4 protein [Candidatus Saccharimonadales bacterium]
VPAAHLHLVGADPGPEVVALGRLPGVTLVGRVEDLRPELSAAQVFACPLQVASGLQNKVLEALAMELPAVVTPVAAEGLELAAGRDLWVCPAGPEFAAGLAQLLEDGPERERLAQAGRVAVAERYTWDRAAGMLEAIYAEVIERAAGGPGRPLAGRAAPGYAP